MTIEMDIFKVVLRPLKFTLVTLPEMLSLDLFEIISEKTSAFVLILEPHVCWYLRTGIVEFCEKLWIDIFYLFNICSITVESSMRITGCNTCLWTCDATTSLQHRFHQLLECPLVNFALAIVHTEERCLFEILHLSFVFTNFIRIVRFYLLKVIHLYSCSWFYTHIRISSKLRLRAHGSLICLMNLV